MAEFKCAMITEFAKLSGMSIDDVLGTSRAGKVSAIRQMYWKLLANNGFSRMQIGAMNGRNHSTITAGIKHINGLLDTDRDLAEVWKKVRDIKR